MKLNQLTAYYAVARFSWSGPLLLERESTRVTTVYRAVTAALRAATTDNAAVTAPTLLQWCSSVGAVTAPGKAVRFCMVWVISPNICMQS